MEASRTVVLCVEESHAIFRGSTSREPGSGGHSLIVLHTITFFLCSVDGDTNCVFISFLPHLMGLDPSFTSATAEFTRKLCKCDQHGVCTQDFFVIHFIVHGNWLRHYIQSCELGTCVFNIICACNFSSVIYVQGLIFCAFQYKH